MFSDATTRLLARLQIELPILQAPMAGVSTPAMAAAVSAAGGLGALGIGAMSVDGARAAIHQFRDMGGGALNVNVFCHPPAAADRALEASWLARLSPLFQSLQATAPSQLSEIYTSFVADRAMLAMLLDERPPVVSFHFGLPDAAVLKALRQAGIVLLAAATNPVEAAAIEAAGVDAVVAQGYEAGGHRGQFDPAADDSKLGSLALVRLLSQTVSIPVIAAGGIMDGAGIAAALKLGAAAVQMGTAFIALDESLADAGYRQRLFSGAAHHTVMTPVISGRAARCLGNDFTDWGAAIAADQVPAYPRAYAAGKALHQAGKAAGQFGYGAYWAGQGAPLARTGSTDGLMRQLGAELQRALAD